MTRTYPYGYNGTRLTLVEMEQKEGWRRLAPEFRRRLVALFDAAQDAGKDLGLGTGWRSSAAQERLFRSRYDEVPCPATIRWDGKCWKKKESVAAAAPPGRSYHEETTSSGHALAADLVGDIPFMNAEAGRYGLIHFANVNNEPWHVQPAEIPKARSAYDGSPLRIWTLPGGAPTAPQYPGTPLRRGSKGSDVSLVQTKVGARPDGDFGLRTEQRVKSWQAANRLRADGIVGPVTWRRMFGS